MVLVTEMGVAEPSLAPIVAFAYKRPEHLQRMFDSLRRCPLASQSRVIVFCDGPRKPEDRDAVEATRAVARAQTWAAELEVIERTENLGLSRSIGSGVASVCDKYGKVIVLEDDLRVAPSFLEYMNEGLTRYADDERVMSVSGYMYPLATHGPHDAFFMVHASCWGWATWKRSWQHFGFDDAEYERLRTNRARRHRFNLDGAYPYFQMLERQKQGGGDSWGVLWYLTLFKRDGLLLMPRHTLVANAGQDGSGTHGESESLFRDELSDFEVKDFPPVVPDEDAFRAFLTFIKKRQVPFHRKVFAKLARVLSR